MSFAAPIYLWLLPIVLLWSLGWGWMLARNYHRRRLAYQATAGSLPNGSALSAKLIRHGFLSFALLCLAIASARPQGSPAPTNSTRRGVNLVLLVDGSRSMSSEDILPSRLQAARQAVEVLATEAAGSRFSLIMFGGAPTLLIPQTFDTTAVTLAARSISPDFVGKGGTALVPALKRAIDYLEKAGDQPKVIVIISDGEEGEGDPLLTAMQAQADRHIRIHTITVGTADGGSMPIFERNQKGELVRIGERLDVTKQPLLTHANPDLMGKIAAAAGGKALHLTKGDVAAQVRAFTQQTILPEAVPMDDVATEEPSEWAWLALLLALGSLLAELQLRRWAAQRFGQQPLMPARTSVLKLEVAP